MEKLSFKSLGMSEPIVEALSKLKYEYPSEVQQKVIPMALEGRDIIVKSQTGSGKTAAFAIPICEKVELERNKPQVLVLTPTRELCVQVKEEISNIGRFKRIRCAAIFGKQPFEIQVRELKQRTHVVVGTPGRTLDHMERGSLHLEDIKYLVIDEADKMLDMGFIQQVEEIMGKLPSNKITMLFSATIPEKIEALCHTYLNEPTKIEIHPEKISTERIKHLCYEVKESEKIDFLNKIIMIENPDSCMIFCRTKENVEKLVEKLKNKNYPCNGLHGGMLQDDRLDRMQRFKRGEFIFLVTTDLAARGIDVENITHVINYDIPMEQESYVHRIGRTGRAGKEGKAITFVTPTEYRFLSQIEEYLGFKIEKQEEPLQEDVENARENFYEKINAVPQLKLDKSEVLNKDITKIYISAGKKKKIRPGDIVGAILGIKGLCSEDIGIIDVQDSFSYVDILNGKGSIVLAALPLMSIKGKTVKVEKAMK